MCVSNQCAATLCHGIASGIYYGTLFGMTSRFVFGKEPHNIKRLSGKILMKQIAFGAMGLATFSTIFNGVNCATSLLFPDDRLKPINKGFSGFVSTFFFALYEFRSIKPAM